MSFPHEKILYVLTGPTAVGKTDLSLRWAELNEAEIISCDSLLFYRGMDIGTAKPTLAERARVPHHLIDVCDVTERMDITRYVDLVRVRLAEVESRGRRVLVVGGSGFYLKSFFAPVADEVEVAPELRASLERKLESEGLAALVEELRSIDPSCTEKIDTNNPRRVIRALERCRSTGKKLGELAAEFSRLPLPFAGWNVRLTCLERSAEELNTRITLRVETMLREGLVDEVRSLLECGLKSNPSASRAIGYRETIDMVEGRIPADALAPMIVQNTRALVKKQRTWFRTQLPDHRTLDAAIATAAELF